MTPIVRFPWSREVCCAIVSMPRASPDTMGILFWARIVAMSRATPCAVGDGVRVLMIALLVVALPVDHWRVVVDPAQLGRILVAEQGIDVDTVSEKIVNIIRGLLEFLFMGVTE